MRHAQESANTEEKSSAGDKYETGRAMAQIERDKAAQQVAEALKLKNVLDQIHPEIITHSVKTGSLVMTDQGNFYVAISLGKLSLDGIDYFVVSPTAPLGQSLLRLKAGDAFIFNKKSHVIQQIF